MVRKRNAREAKAEVISHVWGLRLQVNISSTVSPGATSSAYSSPERSRLVRLSGASGTAVLVTQSGEGTGCLPHRESKVPLAGVFLPPAVQRDALGGVFRRQHAAAVQALELRVARYRLAR